MVVVWSRWAAIDPESILKEVKFAVDFKKRLVFVREGGVPLDRMFHQDIEYFSCDSVQSKKNMMRLAQTLDRMFQEGNFSAR